jgi:hypothetical protein
MRNHDTNEAIMDTQRTTSNYYVAVVQLEHHGSKLATTPEQGVNIMWGSLYAAAT